MGQLGGPQLTCRSRSGSSATRVEPPIALSCRCTSPALSRRRALPPPLLLPANMRPSWLPAIDCSNNSMSTGWCRPELPIKTAMQCNIRCTGCGRTEHRA